VKDPRTVVRRPLVTEKGTVLREKSNQYFFEVALSANKIEIKRAVVTLEAGQTIALFEEV